MKTPFDTTDLEKGCGKFRGLWEGWCKITLDFKGNTRLCPICQATLKERQRLKAAVEKVINDWANSLCGKETKRKGDKVYFDWDVFIVNVDELKKRLGI